MESRAHVELNYSRFKFAYGGDYGGRLMVVSLPACVLSTPQLAECRVARPVPGSRNDRGRSTVSVDALPVAGDSSAAASGPRPEKRSIEPAMFALLAGSGSPGGDFGATDLSSSYSWAAGTPGGDFFTTYPIEVPPGLGGPVPQISLDYASGSVDARTHADSGQVSWVGDGWELNAGGYIERSYRRCADDGDQTGDLCWFSSDNATLVLGGRSVRLVRDTTTGVWKASTDAGMRIEKLTLSGWTNGDNDNEYWKITSLDGTQYFFGENKRYAADPVETKSTLTVPVFGNDGGEPCYVPLSYANSWCAQAYRWNLDHVVDSRGNSMTYFYSEFTGNYGRNNNTGISAYDLAAPLDRIEYGTRAGSEGASPAPMRVIFDKALRCEDSCAAADYPDTPLDKYCTSSTSCPNVTSPVFFNKYRLAEITTQVRNQAAGQYRDVHHFQLEQTYPSTLDQISPHDGQPDSSPNLYLESVARVGHLPDGTTELAAPATVFSGVPMENRVTWGDDIGPPYMHYRIEFVDNGMGGETLVTYSDPQCPAGGIVPKFDANPNRCYSVKFQPEGSTAPPEWDLFHKYVVTDVTERDLTGGSPDEVWSYTYSADASSEPTLWRHDYAETSALADRSWTQWLGYPKVTVTHGAGSGPKTVTTTLYHRGLDGDARYTSDESGRVWGARHAAITTPLGVIGRTSTLAGTGSRCLEPSGSTNGSAVRVATCTGAANQVWQRFEDESYYNPSTNKCLDPAGAANGSAVQIWTCATGVAPPDQQWRPQPDGTLKNLDSGRCVQIPNYATGTGVNLTVQDCVGGWNQVWTPTEAFGIANNQSQRCADLWADGTTNGTQVVTWVCNNDPNQLWQQQPNNTWKNPVSNRCLDIVGSGTAAGTFVQLWNCTGAANQIWVPQADGTLKNPVSNRCLDTGANPASQQRLRIADCSASSVTQKWIAAIPDRYGLNGLIAEERTIDGATEVATTYREPTVTQTASREPPETGGQTLTAVMATETATRGRVKKADGTWRWTETQTSYDSYGLRTQVDDRGDTSIADDDVCTGITYSRDTSAYLIDFPRLVVATSCVANPTGAAFLAQERTSYDGSDSGGITQGYLTRTEVATSVSGTTPTWITTSRAAYDTYGRPTTLRDARDNPTTIAYTPPSGGPVLQITTTNPLGHATTITTDGHRGLPTVVTDPNGRTTTANYDALGRLTKLWQYGRPTSELPDYEYTYTMSPTQANVVSTKVLSPTGTQIAIYDLLDGRLRPRQSQLPGPAAFGGRLISDTIYDNRGLPFKESSFWNATAPQTTLASAADTAVPSQTRVTYDNLERVTAEQLWANNVQRWQTTYVDSGDQGTIFPPTGGASRAEWDARGRTVKQHRYATSNATGTPETTSYSYNRLGSLASFTDPAGNQTTYAYDLLGRRTGTTDPNTATTSSSYNAASDVLSTIDGRNQKISYEYDALGRVTNRWAGDVGTGTRLASFSYDSIAKGMPTSATRYDGGAQYITSVTGYSSDYQPTGQSWTIPSAEGLLAGTYANTMTYNPYTRALATVTYGNQQGGPAETLTYGYDGLRAATTLTGLATYIASTTYSKLGQVTQRTYGTGTGPGRMQREYTWDDVTGLLSAIVSKTPAPANPSTWQTVQNDTYAHTADGDVTRITDNTDGQSQCFRYDPHNRLTEAWTAIDDCAANPSTTAIAGSGKYPYWDSWTFDTAGRRATDTHRTSATASTDRAYTYPASGTTAVRPHGVTSVTKTGIGAGTDRFGYDNGGNMTSRTVAGVSSNYSFDAEGSFSQAIVHTTAGDKETRHVYDATGTLLIRREPGATTLYAAGQEFRLAGGTVSCTRYYYTDAGATVAVRTPSGLTWLAGDHQSSANIAVNAATGATAKRWYTPYGLDRNTVTWPTDRGFLNKQTNTSTGLTDLGAREYDPNYGIFISPDPIVDVAEPASFNAYAYAYSNPVTNSDPTGLALSWDPGELPGVNGLA